LPTKAFSLQVKQLTDDGSFEGVASSYDTEPDLGGDVIEFGAFTKTLQASGNTRPLLWQHSSPVGVVTLSDTPAALLAKGKLSMGIQQARDAYTLLQDQVVRGLSIGFEVVKSDFVGDVRVLKEIRLWEVSLVTFPMNQSAQVTAVKSARLAAEKAAQEAAIAREIRSFRGALKRL
jgi:HK97 family phage prohead protease